MRKTLLNYRFHVSNEGSRSVPSHEVVKLNKVSISYGNRTILDEPLHGLDTYNRRRVKKIIEAFCQRRDKTMIMVTHYESELPDTITNRIFLKRNG